MSILLADLEKLEPDHLEVVLNSAPAPWEAGLEGVTHDAAGAIPSQSSQLDISYYSCTFCFCDCCVSGCSNCASCGGGHLTMVTPTTPTMDTE